jgi:hypothetical protein
VGHTNRTLSNDKGLVEHICYALQLALQVA